MKRWKIAAAAAGTLLLVGGALYETGCFSGDSDDATLGQPSQIKSANPMDTPAGWRYRQNRPHHWRYIMLQK
ncbi:MAG TPA: hypothetical protein VMG10_35275 [Gemmataceae bacterium]|nr:hypothetical protein [Gemmataceae bacterium]